MTKGKMVDFIEKLNIDDLQTLNKLIIQKTHEINRQISLSFKVGQHVWFIDRYGKRHEGEIKRINKKNITIYEERSKTNPYPVTWSI